MRLARLKRLFHTIRYLRPIQIYARLWTTMYRPKPDTRPAPPLRRREGDWQRPALRLPSMSGPTSFCFLNVRGEMDGPERWNNPSRNKLWLYNLHYFDDLNAEGSEARLEWHQSLISRWVDENPPGKGTGWDSYPLSLRVVNWIKWSLAGHTLSPAAVQSLAVQARYLSKRVEWHLLGNHVLANAKALVFAGVFFSGREAEAWLDKGLQILRREIAEQVLADGGHFERSPMYHSILLEDLLDLHNLARAYGQDLPGRATPFGDSWLDTIARMRRWLKAMCHPDGQIAFFNDAAWDIASTPGELDAYAQRLELGIVVGPGSGLIHLKASGYIRLQQGPAVALLDVGEIGPDYLPGHAHADTLSFELSLFGTRVLVNAGTSTYEPGPQRERERSTAAHNTVAVDEQDSSETWASFRVARRAYPVNLSVSEGSSEEMRVECSHNGYCRLRGRVMHRRTWRLKDGLLRVEDRLDGSFSSATARFHLSPDVGVPDGLGAVDNGTRITVGEHLLTWRVSGGAIAVEPAEFHPAFGVSQASRCLVVRFNQAEAASVFEWIE